MTEFPELLNKFIEQNIHIYSVAKYFEMRLDRSTLYVRS